jgi:O-antigen/teichoic acid export membrane protein
MGAIGIILGMAFSISIVDIVMFFITKMGNYSSIKLISKDTLVGFYKYGIPIAASSLGLWILTQSNKFVLQFYHGSFFNGLAGVGYNLTFSILFPLFAIIAYAAVPRIINLYETGKSVNRIITKLTAYYTMIFLPIVFIYCYFSKEIVLLLSNAKYADAYLIIPFLALSAFFSGLAEYTVIQYHLAKKTYIYTLIKVCPSIASLIISIFLLPIFKGESILIVLGILTLASQIIYFLLSITINIKGLSWNPPVKLIGKCILSLLASFFILNFYTLHLNSELYNNFFIKSAIVIIVYIVSLKLQSVKLRAL